VIVLCFVSILCLCYHLMGNKAFQKEKAVTKWNELCCFRTIYTSAVTRMKVGASSVRYLGQSYGC